MKENGVYIILIPKKYNKSIVQILSDSFDAYIKESRTKKDDSIGIQVKQMERSGKAGVRIPSYFKMSFKEVFKEKGEIKEMKTIIYLNLSILF